jgi:hypothetical protein
MFEEHIPKAIPKDIKDMLLAAFGKDEIGKIHNNFYTNTSEHDFFQGNAINNAMFVSLPNRKIADHPVLVLSNPCDTDLRNEHNRFPKITYCAVKSFSGFKDNLEQHSGMSVDEINSYMENVKAQLVSDLLYLPIGSGAAEERVAIFSETASCDLGHYIKNQPIVTTRLAQKAYYLLLTKISIHFLRFGDMEGQEI